MGTVQEIGVASVAPCGSPADHLTGIMLPVDGRNRLHGLNLRRTPVLPG